MRLILLLLLSSNLSAAVGMNGAPWPSRPRPQTMEVAPLETVENPPPVPYSRSLTDRVWKPGIFTVGLLSAVAGGVYYLNQHDAKPVDLTTQSTNFDGYGEIKLFSDEPIVAQVQVWQEGEQLLSWKGEINGNEAFDFTGSNKSIEVQVLSESSLSAELSFGGKRTLLPTNNLTQIP